MSFFWRAKHGRVCLFCSPERPRNIIPPGVGQGVFRLSSIYNFWLVVLPVSRCPVAGEVDLAVIVAAIYCNIRVQRVHVP